LFYHKYKTDNTFATFVEKTREGQISKNTKKSAPAEIKSEKSCSSFSGRIIHKKFVPLDKTVNGDYYLGVMKRLLLWSDPFGRVLNTGRSCSLLHDNTSANKCIAVRKFLTFKSVLILNHFSYSSCDYFLFPELKMKLKGKQVILDIQKVSTEVILTISKEDFHFSKAIWPL